MVRRVVDPPYLQGLFMPRWMPAWMKRAQFWLGDAAVLDRVLAPPLNALRAELGLPDVRRGIIARYAHSPQRVIGMFPDWFAPPAPDWPKQTRLTGFPLYDERGVTKFPDDLLKFLNEGPPPV